ncbi:Thioredoxin-related transmembrane protein 2 [Chlorella vulgaris]
MGLFTGMKAAGLQRFVAPYYLSNVLLLASYLEKFALTLLGMAVMMKFWRRQSMDSFLSDAITYGKSAVALMVWYMDWRICIYYCLLYIVIYLLFPQPIFRGASCLEHFTPASFHSMVLQDPQPADVAWLVEFYAPWAPPCIHLEPVFAELSLTYTNDKLRFGKVDASRWSQLAKQHKVAVYGALPQLPTFVLFEKGKEVGRIPHVFEDGSVASMKIRRQDIVVAFGLEDYLEASRTKKPVTPAASGKKSTKKR